MSKIRSRKHPAGRYLTALSIMGAAALSAGIAHAAEAPPKDQAGDHEGRDAHITINGQRNGYRATQVSSPKKTQPLLDTPQTVTVIREDLLDEQGAVSLTDALRNTPGITMQLGENGSTSAGDTFQMRGFSSQTSLFLDGIRDMGAVSRDTFNVEQIEIAKGPAGADTGRGASSGYINLVSKQPTLGGRNSATLSLYSDGGARFSVDSNTRTGETSAFRLNIMDQDVDAAGRSYAKKSDYGVAPAFSIGLGTPTVFSVFGQYIQQKNVPDGGLPTIGEKGYFVASTVANSAALMAAPKVNRENFYGSPSDAENVEAYMLTTKVQHTFPNGAVLTNTSRYGSTSMTRSLTGINGITTPSATPSTWTLARSRQGIDQKNSILYNQTNVNTVAHTGGIEHDLAFGLEFGYESQLTRTLATTYVSPTGVSTPTTVTIPAANLYTPNVNDVLPPLVRTDAQTDGSTTTLAGYVFDTIKLNDQWRINASARVDNYSIKTTTINVATSTTTPPVPVGTRVAGSVTGTCTLLSWNLSTLYKPTPNSSLYVAYGNSLTPPGGNSFALSTSTSSTSNPAFDPQENDNFEVGAKWDVFNKRLSLTAAWYETIAKNELTQADPLIPGVFIQVGERKVNGLEFSAVGVITRFWHVSGGIQTLHTEIAQGTTGNSAAGAATRWSPELTATFWTTYLVNKQLTLGIGASYTGEQLRVIDPTAALATSNMPKIEASLVTNAMASYDLNRRIALQLNVYNLTNEHYISTLNNSGARMTLGQPLTATLTARVKF